MKILLVFCLAVVISVSVARPRRGGHGGPPRHGERHGGPPPGGRPPPPPPPGFPPMGPPPLDQACRIDDYNGNTIQNKPELCKSCADCSVGPFPASQNGIYVKAYFCRYHTVFQDLEETACLVKAVSDDRIIKQHRCHDSDQCNVGPITMTLRDGTVAHLYLCEMPEQDDAEDSHEEGAEHSMEHHRGPPGMGHRGPPGGEGPEKPHKPIIDQLREDACLTLNSDNTVVSRKECCQNCTGGPVAVTTDGGLLILFYCKDRIDGATFPPPPPGQGGRGQGGPEGTRPPRGGGPGGSEEGGSEGRRPPRVGGPGGSDEGGPRGTGPPRSGGPGGSEQGGPRGTGPPRGGPRPGGPDQDGPEGRK